jgi:hypothetical protein
MSYDFAVLLPSELGELGLTAPLSDASIGDFYERFANAPGEAPAPFVTFAKALDKAVPFGDDFDGIDEGHWLMVEPGALRHMISIAASWSFVYDARRTLLELGFTNGLALLDPDRRLLFDPTDSVWVSVTTSEAVGSPYLSRSLLEQLIDTAQARDGFLVVAEEEDYVFVQTRYADGVFEVEHRGGEDQHFRATTTDPQLVTEVIWSWVTDGDGWRTALPWERIRL